MTIAQAKGRNKVQRTNDTLGEHDRELIKSANDVWAKRIAIAQEKLERGL